MHDIPALLEHLLERVDWRTDLHFQTRTTIDTLDYSGHGFNAGSKLVIAAAGPPRRELARELPAAASLPDEFRDVRLCLPGIVAVSAPPCSGRRSSAEILATCESDRHDQKSAVDDSSMSRRPDDVLSRFCQSLSTDHSLRRFPLIVLVDDARFVAESLHNFLWVVFTRSNPAADIDGVEAFTADKHWGCRGPLVIDARIKSHHAPALETDPHVSRRVDELAARGGPLHGLF